MTAGTVLPMAFELAQINIGRLRAPIDGEQVKDFVDLLDPVNEVADASPGFVWRLQTEDGNATSAQAFEWDAAGSAGVIVNMSVWTDLESLGGFVYGALHRTVLRRRREWFERMPEAYTACWWVQTGHRPTTDEAEDRVRHLRQHGPTPLAFTLQQSFPAPGAPSADTATRDDWFCPA
jgi:hypothetical protein